MISDKHKRFCDEYLIDLNATRAYLVAYPSVKSNAVARANASRLLTNANIQNYIAERMKAIEDEKIAKLNEVLIYLSTVMRGECTTEEIVVEGKGEGEGVSEARIIEKPPSIKERNRAAELLGNRYGAFKDQEERELKKLKTEQEIERLRRQNNGNNDEDDGVTLVYD